MIVESDRCTYASAISGEINFKSNINTIYNLTTPVLMAHLEYISTQIFLPSGSPSVHAARTKALAITTFASCILVLPAPVLWNSLI